MRQDAGSVRLTESWPEFDALVRRLGWAGTGSAPAVPPADWPALLARVKALRHRVLEEMSAAALAPGPARELQDTLLLGWHVVFQVWALQEGLFERHDPSAAARKLDELRQTYVDRTGVQESVT